MTQEAYDGLSAAPGVRAGPELMEPERLVAPDSWTGHIPFLFWLMASVRPRRFVELGVHTGNSYCAAAQAVSSLGLGTECYGIDHWMGDPQAGHYGEDVYTDLKAWHDPRYTSFSRLLRMSFEDGRAYVPDHTVDLLHIDGLHTYEAVKGDFETWRHKMSGRCIVLFHDTNVHERDFGVWRFWREIGTCYPTFEFLHSNGLGIAYVGDEPIETPSLADLFDLEKTPERVQALRVYFARLGEGLTARVQRDDLRYHSETVARELARVQATLDEIDRDRWNVRHDRDHWKSRAALADRWDQLALHCVEALNVNLEAMAEAIRRLYNADNPQAMKDRRIVSRVLNQLIYTGTVEADFKERIHAVLKRVRPTRNTAQSAEGNIKVEQDPALAMLRADGLFVADHYTLTQEALDQGWDPLEHYLEVGEGLGIEPSPLFEPNYYARRYPDVVASGFGLLRHYARMGRAEGRHGLSPARRMHVPALPEGDKPRVLLMMSEADGSASALLAWRLIEGWADSHEVVVFLERTGPLRVLLDRHCQAVIELPDEPGMLCDDLDAVALRVAEAVRPTFVLAGSPDIRRFLPRLAVAGLGIVTVVPQFSVEIRPRNEVYTFLAWSHRIVFTARAIAESFAVDHAYASQRRFDVVSPGVPAPPPRAEEVFGTAARSKAVRALLRPRGHESDTVIVGMGPPDVHHGIDLFVMVAAAVVRARPQASVRFVWIGRPPHPDALEETPRALDFQIARADLGERFAIVDVEDGVTEVHAHADVFALTARVDALPASAMASMTYGVPVVCFAQTNAVAEHLSACPQTAALVVPALDTTAMASAVVDLVDEPAARAALSEPVLQVATTAFNMDRYAAELARLGAEAAAEAQAVIRDHAVVAAAGEDGFDIAFCTTPYATLTERNQSLWAYLVQNRVSGTETTLPVGLRRPLPGFHPLIYAEDVLNLDRTTIPLAHWLDAGRPAGRWTHRVIRLDQTASSDHSLRVLVHGHFYHVDMIDNMLARLNANGGSYDLFLTTVDESRAEHLRAAVAEAFTRGEAHVRVVPNLGRDVGAFLTGLNDVVAEDQYDVIGHVHGKKSVHLDGEGGDVWRTFLWDHLIGGRAPAADVCMAAFAADPDLGLVFPEDPNLHGWDRNLDIARDLARRMGHSGDLPQAFDWPIGTMFWARPRALAPLFALGLDWTDYPVEPVPEDGTLLHALERLVPIAAETAGLTFATSHLPGVSR